jgi:muramoyltetrapeptide carboxypeptidase LdcA involved in peptidoglycan recycling
LLPRLGRDRHTPKILQCYSDITALLLSLHHKTAW